MAPEQVRGEQLDGRADLFSLGVVLYELLLRRKPFPADTVTTLIYQILHEDPLADPGISRALGEPSAAFLRRCLAKQRDLRFQDAASFASEARSLACALAAARTEATAPTAKLAVAPSAVVDSAATRPTATPVGSGFPTGAVLTLAGVVLLAAAALIGVRQLGRRSAHAPVSSQAPVAVAAGDLVRSAVERPTPALAASPSGAPPRAQGVAVTTRPHASVTAPPVVAIFYCRRGAEFNVSPEGALVTVDGQPIGKADDWDGKGGGQTYVFPRAGRHLVKLALAGYRDAWIEIVVDAGAPDEVADVDTVLAER
jgi:serine/threonine-protein kinase